MKDKNFRENRVGGIDCDRYIASLGGYHPCTLTDEEAQAVIDLGVEIMPLDQSVKDAYQAENLRQEAKRARDLALENLTYEFDDGRVIQTRPKDAQNIVGRIATGLDKKWILIDNTRQVVTVAELQEAYDQAVIKMEDIWDEYGAKLDEL